MQRLRRGLIVILACMAVLLALAGFALRVPAVAALVRALPIGPGLEPTRKPPVIAAPAGPMPGGPVGVTELAQLAGADFRGVGSGFFLHLPGGAVIGVTTAHSVGRLGQAGYGLQQMAFALPGAAAHLADFSALYGAPDIPFSGDNLSVDYVLLRPSEPVDPALAPEPDPRGGPQPGERVALYSGLGGVGGSAHVLFGTVTSSVPAAAWLLMDDSFEPGGMSGSPVLSAYTGRVVGMAVAAVRQQGRVLIGLNPIGGLVQHALAARDFPDIAGYNK